MIRHLELQAVFFPRLKLTMSCGPYRGVTFSCHRVMNLKIPVVDTWGERVPGCCQLADGLFVAGPDAVQGGELRPVGQSDACKMAVKVGGADAGGAAGEGLLEQHAREGARGRGRIDGG